MEIFLITLVINELLHKRRCHRLNIVGETLTAGGRNLTVTEIIMEDHDEFSSRDYDHIIFLLFSGHA